MKNKFTFVVALCILMSLCLACIPASAEDDRYATSNDGELLYTVDFSGDEFYKPEVTSGDPTVVVDPVDSGRATISTKTNKSKSRWGGEISCLPLNETTAYTMYFTVTRDTVEGALGVYADDHYGVYGYSYNQRFLSGTTTLSGHSTVVYAEKNVDLISNLKTNGGQFPSVQELAMEINGQKNTLKAYIKDDGGNWVLLDETLDGEILVFYTEHLGLFLYSYYADMPVTISDVNIYKGMCISGEKLGPVETKPETTAEATKPETKAETKPETKPDTKPETKVETKAETKAPETNAPEETKGESKKGCGSAVGAGIAVLLLPAAAVICRRKKH